MAKAKEEKVNPEVAAEATVLPQSPDGGDTTQTAEQADNPSQSVGENNDQTLSVSKADSSPKGRALGETEGFGESKPTMAELIAAEKKRMEEYVTIQLLKDNGKYKDDVYVSVNGQNCRIQRGIPVRIKRKFAIELAKSQYEDQRTAARIALLVESAAEAKL